MNQHLLVIGNRIINLRLAQEVKVNESGIYIQFSNSIVHVAPSDLDESYPFIVTEVNPANMNVIRSFNIEKALKYFKNMMTM